MKKIIGLRPSTIIDVISALFILLFVYTALSKFYNFDNFQWVLGRSPLIGANSILVSYLVPLSEILIAGLLFFPSTRLLGLYCATILMTLFTIYIIYMLLFTPDLPCSCGGVLKELTWTQHLIFNIFFVLLGIIGIISEKKHLKERSVLSKRLPIPYH